MSKEHLEGVLRMLHQKTERMIKNLPPAEKGRFLEGMFFAFHILERFANLAGLTPFEREMFIGTAKCDTFNQARELGRSTSQMEASEAGNKLGEFNGLTAAAALNYLSDIPLTLEERQHLQNAEESLSWEEHKKI